MIIALLMLLIVAILLDAVALVMLYRDREIKTEIRDLLRVNKEWVDHAKDIRRDTAEKANKVELKADQLAAAVQKVPEETANKVVAKISGGGSASDSDKFPVVRPTGEPNL